MRNLINGQTVELPEWMIQDKLTGEIHYLTIAPAEQLDEIAPVIAVAARAVGAAVGNKVADKVLGEDDDNGYGVKVQRDDAVERADYSERIVRGAALDERGE